MFINSAENEISNIIYKGELESNIKEQKSAYIILLILLYSYLVVGITVVHYLKF